MSDAEYPGVGQEHHILEVEEDGLHLELDDGSSWDIPPGPSTKVACWYPAQRILVEESEDNDGYFLLTNLDTSEPDTVKARLSLV